jgi:hypothetical protein
MKRGVLRDAPFLLLETRREQMQKNAADMTVTEFEEWLKQSKSRIYHWVNEPHIHSGLINRINCRKRSIFQQGTRRSMNRGASKWKP